MATIVSTPSDCQFFLITDLYRFDVDNRPLYNLLANDVAINAELEATTTELVNARTGLLTTYMTLKARLDAMEDSIGSAVSLSDMTDIQGHQYGDFINNSEALRRASPSGWLDHNGIADLIAGTQYDLFAGIETTATLGTGHENSVSILTSWGSSFRPLRALVNGWVVRAYNEVGGAAPSSVPVNYVTVGLPPSPTTGKQTNFAFLEVWIQRVPKGSPVFYRYGALGTNFSPQTTTDHLDPDAIHTVRAMAPGGDWLQLQHRIRVVANVAIESGTCPDGYQDAGVLAQGPQSAGVAGYTYANMETASNDAGLWRAGAGNDASKTALGTYDGYVYSIPLFLAHRRNSGVFALTNQNGARTNGSGSSGTLVSGVSGRPDGLFYDAIDQRDLLDLRTRVSLEGMNLDVELERSWQMLIRGELRTNWKQLQYNWTNGTTWSGAGVWGHTLLPVDEITVAPNSWTNPLRDFSVNAGLVGAAPLAIPDGQRNTWSRIASIQPVKFTFTQGDHASPSPPGFVTYDPTTETLTFNAAVLSGTGVGGTKIGTTPPVVMQASSLVTQPTLVTSGLGTQTSTCKMSGVTAAAAYVGYVNVVYPGSSGLSFAHKRVLKPEVVDAGTTLYPAEQFGQTGTPKSDATGLASPQGVAWDGQTPPHYVVCDTGNHRVVVVDPATWAITAQFGVTGVTGADNTHLSSPVGVAVNTSDGSIFVCDTGNHRIVKLGSTLGYLTQFGVTAVAGADNTHCSSPGYVAVSGSVVYATDTGNHRLLKLTTALGYTFQFGTTGIAGAGTTGLNSPLGVTPVPSGFGAGVWVADSANKRVVILDTSLAYKYQLSEHAPPNTLTEPHVTDVAVDAQGNYYISLQGQHLVLKYNSALLLVAQFGVRGVPGADNTHLNQPAGLAIDQSTRGDGWSILYVCDTGNARLLALNLADLSYARQYGVTGVTTSSPSVGTNLLAGSISDVAVNKLTGDVFFCLLLYHVVRRLDKNLNPSTLGQFGTYGLAAGISGSTTQLNLPQSIAVKSNATQTAVLVQVVDKAFGRVVVLNGNLNYSSQYVPTYNTTTTSLQAINLFDVEYSDSEATAGRAPWYLAVYEAPLGTNPATVSFAVLRFFDTPSGSPNYASRFVTYDFVVGIFTTPTQVVGGTASHGLVFHDIITPTTYSFTDNPPTNIYFKFYTPTGLSTSSDGTRVLVADQPANVVHCFDTDSGIYRGQAGVRFQAGDDDASLNLSWQGIMHGRYFVVVDTGNHRLLRRHVCHPWVSQTGTITTMIPPSGGGGADLVRLYYEVDAYQGTFGGFGAMEAIFKADVRWEGSKIYASTLGLGAAISSRYREFKNLRGMVTRLPLPTNWNDWEIQPVGMHASPLATEDDGPYLSLPVTLSEGIMGGQATSKQIGASPLTSKQALQQVARTVPGPDNPRVRGYQSIIPRTENQPTGDLVGVDASDLVQGLGANPSTSSESIFTPIVNTGAVVSGGAPVFQNDFKPLRYGAIPVRGFNLLQAIPHFSYYPFLYQRVGRLLMGVLAEGDSGPDVAVGAFSDNGVDGFFLYGRPLIR